jgi:hypothetical protein
MLRPFPASLVAVLLLLSGCLASAPATLPIGGQDLSEAAGLPIVARFSSIIDPTSGRGEPSLGVAPDGTLYANGRYLLAPSSINTGAIWASKDGGVSWKFLAAPTVTPDNDPDLAVDKDGTIWFDTLTATYCNSAASSRDKGATWTMSPIACFPPSGDRQYIIPTEKGTAYLYSHHGQTNWQCVIKTTDYGRTWLPSGCVDQQFPPGSLGRSGWGGGGFWNEKRNSVWMTFTWTESGVWYAGAGVTRDGGATWSLVKVKNMGGQRVGLGLVVGAADAAGNVYLSWAETQNKTDLTVWMVSSTDDGRTWSAAKRVDAGTNSKVFPAITAGAPGKVAIAYYEADERERPLNVSGKAAWNVTLAWTDDALADQPAWQRGQLSTGSLRHGPICPNGSSCPANRQLLDYFALKTMPDGRVASLWTSTDDIPGRTANVFGVTDRVLLH